MRGPHTRWSVIVLLALLAPAPGAAQRAPDRFVFRAETPEARLTEGADRLFAVEIEGFETHPRKPGTPDLPWRTVLVALPPTGEPQLEIATGGHAARRIQAVPRPVPRIAADTPEIEGSTSLEPLAPSSVRRLYEIDPAVYSAAASDTRPLAWLGKIGVLRDQRYVEVHLAPVRYDASSEELVIQPVLDVTVRFGAPSGDLEAREDPQFEAVYRRAFLNYGQGRSFRLSTMESQPLESAGASADTAPLARWRIVVRANGVVRLDYLFFANQAPAFLLTDPTKWKLTSHGNQVPLHLKQAGGNPNALEPGEWVQFYGQALDDGPEQVLNTDTGGLGDLYEVRDFSDDNVYFLSVETALQPAMSTRAAAPGVTMPPLHFPATVRREVDDVFFPLAGGGISYSLPLLFETAPQRIETIALAGLATGTEPAAVRVALRGVSECDGYTPDHASRVSLKNTLDQTLVLPAGPNNSGNENLGQFDGQSMFLHNFAWAHSGGDPQLSDPLGVVVRVDDLNFTCSGAGNVKNDVLLDWIEVDYQRSFVALGDQLIFDYPDGTANFAISGLQSGGPELIVYEVTREIGTSGVADAVRLTDAQTILDGPTYTLRFRMDADAAIPDGTLRRFVVAGASGVSTPAAADFRADRVSSLRDDLTPAELIVVAHPNLLDSRCSDGGNPCAYDVECTESLADRCEVDPASALGRLLAQRASQGIPSRVARVQDVEDEFNGGLAGPLAIKNLIAWTMAGGWGGVAPSFVMLLGDGSYAYKSGTASGSFVPTQLMIKKDKILAFYASDNVIGTVLGGDQLPEVAIGRVSARTLAEAEIGLEKILDYDDAPAGGWRSHAVFISDRANDFDDFEPIEFERINRIGEDLLLGTASYTKENLRYWSGNCVPPNGPANPTCDKIAMRQDIQDAINAVSGPGAALVQYMGHGNFDLWSSDTLFCANNAVCTPDDIATLDNGLKLPWLIVHNCLSGGFHSLALKSLGEQWQKWGGGGAAAVFAPSGLGFRFLGQGVTEVIWDDLFGSRKERQIAVPVMNSLVRLCTQDSIEGCQFYTLLGDPSMKLALPDVDPAHDLVAQAANGAVNLTWTASATPDATYDIYRTKQLLPPFTLPYEKIGVAPSNQYADTAVVNTQHYYYYVVAKDQDGFESRWSNFNSDCDVVGPDCVVATPINLTPPATPAGLSVEDSESGNRLNVAWNYNPEPDIDFYTVHFGPTPALGQTVTSTANYGALTGLENGVPWYVAVTVTNTSGAESAPTPTLSAVPSLVLGAHSPGLIADLRLARSGSDALLSWSAVTTDIYGLPTDVAEYEVYRGTTAQFVPSPANRIGVTGTPSFLDDGALAAGEPNYHYLVRAVDTLGNPGGLGRQLPNGTMGLTLGLSTTPGNAVLSWPPVTTDVHLAPTAIASYEVYAANQPFEREAIESGVVGPPIATVPGTSAEVTLPPQNRFFTVLAVDVRGNRSPF